MGLQLPVVGSYSSALSRNQLLGLGPYPHATRTLPLERMLAVWEARGLDRDPVGLQLPVVGSYTSALANSIQLLPLPPATRTLPLTRTLAVWE